ncbi:MAG: 50S ribosomal protein L18 [candidate division Zixibacteria bacterium SM23_73_2]|nr:MAG: 50S ribosomal protein L18 [candidate division Zixibacteria bacterium SM23_73_2]
MRDKKKRKEELSEKRKKRVREKVKGNSLKPRLTVYKSLNHIYAQLIDDEEQSTLLGASSLSPEIRKSLNDKQNKTQISKTVGNYVAKLAKEKGIILVVFDRNRYRYHGRIRSLAEGAREGGLKF